MVAVAGPGRVYEIQCIMHSSLHLHPSLVPEQRMTSTPAWIIKVIAYLELLQNLNENLKYQFELEIFCWIIYNGMNHPLIIFYL